VTGVRVAIVVALCCGLAPARRALAESPEAEGERLAEDAVNAYKGADYKRAVELLQKAYEIRQVPALLYNMAKAYDKLGDIDRAYDAYHLYADSAAADPKLKARAEQRVAALADAKRKKKAEQRAAEAPPPPANPPPPAVVEPPKPTGPTAEEQRATAHEEFLRTRKRDRLIAIIGGGATVAFAAVAIGLSADALVLQNKFHENPYPGPKSGLESDAKVRAGVADGFWCATVAAAGVTGYFAWRAFLRKEPASSAMALAPFASPTGGGIAAVGHF
jgi:tetratricopeptide (TPR) repeat protein